MDSSSGPEPVYPVPYAKPSVEQVTATLERVHARIDAAILSRVIDSQTRQEIVDFSQPNPRATLDDNGQRMLRPLIYPAGVVHNGMLLAHEVTGDKRYADFTLKRFNFYAELLPKLTDWPARGNPLANFIRPNSLDACGAFGAAMIKARRMNLGPDFKEVIHRFADYVSTSQFRLEDGTLARNSPSRNSVWADDEYMSIPLLGQMGKLTGETKYYDDAARQVVQIAGYLFNAEKGMYAHCTNLGSGEQHPRFYWGRANGWCIMAAAELLEVMPEDHPRRDEVLKLFRAHARGMAECQSASGLWRQLLDKPDSYLETSATAMITFAIARGVNRGWLDASNYGPVAQAGWNGLATRITDKGTIEGSCVGTNYANDAMFYYNRPATDDIHGYGPTLLAGAEMIRLLKNDKLRIDGGSGANSPVRYRPAQ
jgi:rhamnogalacturonyl hydrolase YesR